MTPTLETTAERELQELYTQYKALALSAGATLMLDREVEPLAGRVDELLDECRSAGERATPYAGELCAAVETLRPLLSGDVTEETLARARGAHRRVRRAVWNVIPCEYVPCCAPAHDHNER